MRWLPLFVLCGCPLTDKAEDTGAAEGDGTPPNLNTGFPPSPSEPGLAYEPLLAGCTVTAENDEGDYGRTATYDADGRKVEELSWWPDGGDLTTYTWDDTNCLTAIAGATGTFATFTCDAFGNPTLYRYGRGAGAGEVAYTYTYDAENRPITAVATQVGSPTSTSTYEWDGDWLVDWYLVTDWGDDSLPGNRYHGTLREDGRQVEWDWQLCGSGGLDTCVDIRTRVLEYAEDGQVLGVTETDYVVYGSATVAPTHELDEERVAVAIPGDDPRLPARFDFVTAPRDGEWLYVFTLDCP